MARKRKADANLTVAEGASHIIATVNNREEVKEWKSTSQNNMLDTLSKKYSKKSSKKSHEEENKGVNNGY